MPAESIALALPPAFMACVQCFELIQLGRHFKGDVTLSTLDLKICEIHLLRWGAAANLTKGDATGPPEKLSKYPDEQLQKAVLVLNRIVAVFNNTREECEFDSLGDDAPEEQAGTTGVSSKPADQDEALQKSHRYLDKLKSKYKSATGAVTHGLQSASDRTKWALYKKKHLTALVASVSSLIDRLEKLFPELLEVEKTLAHAEAADADKEVAKTLQALATSIDGVMAQALADHSKSNGMSFEDVEVGDHVKAHLGNRYAAGEKSTGHDNHSFRKLRINGFAEFRGGNDYGFKAGE